MGENKYTLKTVIQDYGTFKLSANSISENSKFHFDISELNHSDIDKILKENNIEKRDLAYIDALSGGIAVLENDIAVIEPTCCNNLQSIDEWEAILKSNKNRWCQLWIGHPWIYYKVVNDVVYFSDYSDTVDYKQRKDIGIKKIREIPITVLTNQLKKMRIELNEFNVKLRLRLVSIGIKDDNKFANELMGIEEQNQ